MSGTKRTRIAIGIENCKNDLPIIVGNSLPNIQSSLDKALNDKDFEAMKVIVKRLKLVVDDLDDMVHEINGDISI